MQTIFTVIISRIQVFSFSPPAVDFDTFVFIFLHMPKFLMFSEKFRRFNRAPYNKKAELPS